MTVAFALVIGIALGMLGGGGSILTVPVFTYVTGLDPKVAIASSLPVVAIISAAGAFGHWRAGNVQLRTAALFGLFTMAGGFSGARLSQWLSGSTQMFLFAAVMLMAAVAMLRGGAAPDENVKPESLPLLRLAPLGIGVGVLTGLVGVGGGFLIVPALVQIARVPMRSAVGTSLLVIALNAAAGTAGYLGHVNLPFDVLVPFTGMALVGIAIGTWSAQRVPQEALRRGFALLLLVVGGFVLYRNYREVASTPVAVSADRITARSNAHAMEVRHVLQAVL
jgi:uncharacterized protein